MGRKVYGVNALSQASVLDGFNLIFILMHTKTRSKLTSATYNMRCVDAAPIIHFHVLNERTKKNSNKMKKLAYFVANLC